MIKDLLENFIKELQNEKNKTNLYSVMEPFTDKIKLSYYFIIFLIILIILNLIYSNIILTEIVKNYKIQLPINII